MKYELNLFIIELQQVFLSLVALGFSFFIFSDIKKIKENVSIPRLSVLVPIFLTLVFGLSYSFYEALGQEGLFYSIALALLVSMSFFGPKYAVSLFIYLLLSRPWETYDHQLMESLPRDIFYLAIIVLGAYKIFRKDYSLRFNLGTVLIILFSSWVFFSAFFSSNSSNAIYMFFDIFMKGVIAFFLIQNSYEKSSDFIVAKLVLVLAIIEKSIISFYQTYLQSLQTNGVQEEFQRLESVGILSNSNDIAAVFILAIPFCLFFILRTRLRPFHWIFMVMSALLMSYLVWKSQSRGALLALISTFASYTLIRINSKKIIAGIGVLTLLGALGSFALMKRNSQDLEGSTNNRIIFWKAGANMAIRNPVFGVGFWGFNRNFQSYAIDGNTGSEGTHMTAHSSWIQVMAENGFIALFLFVSLWAYALKRSYEIRKDEPEYLMSLVGYGVAMTFLSHAYLLFPYILSALAITQASVAIKGHAQEESLSTVGSLDYA